MCETGRFFQCVLCGLRGFDWGRVGITCGRAKRWPQHFKLDLWAPNVVNMHRTLPFSGEASETADQMQKITLRLSNVIYTRIKTRGDTRCRTTELKSRVNHTMTLRIHWALVLSFFLCGVIVIFVPLDSPWEGNLSAWPLAAAVITPQRLFQHTC